MTGMCSYPATGLAFCDDGDQCTENDTCVGTLCRPGPMVMCPPMWFCCSTMGGCNPTGCVM
jgi:hypothetical protein